MRQMKFGLEIEVSTKLSKAEMIQGLRNAGIQVEGSHYGSQVSNVWKVQPDGSINGWELVSPPLNSIDEVKTVIQVLRKELKVRCTIKTGLHIHHDVQDFNLEQLKNVYKIYNKYELNAIKSILDPRRANNAYCRPIKNIVENVLEATTIEEFKRSVGTRYLTVNNKCYVKYGTLEFRGHKATTTIDEVLSWIELTNAIINKAATMKEIKPLQSTNNEDALMEMIEELGLQENKMVNKVYKRLQKFWLKAN